MVPTTAGYTILDSLTVKTQDDQNLIKCGTHSRYCVVDIKLNKEIVKERKLEVENKTK